MEFLYKLYDHEYFGIGLFIVITVLTLLFLLILFFGKKDEKQRKLEETKKLELEQNAFKESNEVVSDLSVPEIAQPILQPEEPVQSVSNEMVDIPVIERSIEMPVLSEEPVVVNNEPVINIETQPVTQEQQPVVMEETPAPVMDDFTVSEDVKFEGLESIDVNSLFQTNLEDINKVEEVKNDETISLELPEISNLEEPEFNPFVIEDIPVEQPVMNTEVQPVVQETVIPKEDKKMENPFELPKLNQNSNSNERISDFDSLFGNIESETYNLKK